MEKNWTFNLLEKTEEKWSFEKPNFNSIDKTENRKELKETEKEFMDRIKKRMDTRKQLLQKTCKKYGERLLRRTKRLNKILLNYWKKLYNFLAEKLTRSSILHGLLLVHHLDGR